MLGQHSFCSSSPAQTPIDDGRRSSVLMCRLICPRSRRGMLDGAFCGIAAEIEQGIAACLLLGRAIHKLMPVSGEPLDELSGPLVHTDLP